MNVMQSILFPKVKHFKGWEINPFFLLGEVIRTTYNLHLFYENLKKNLILKKIYVIIYIENKKGKKKNENYT